MPYQKTVTTKGLLLVSRSEDMLPLVEFLLVLASPRLMAVLQLMAVVRAGRGDIHRKRLLFVFSTHNNSSTVFHTSDLSPFQFWRRATRV